MSNDAKKTSQLGITTGMTVNDRIVVLTSPAGSAQTQTITVGNLFGNSNFGAAARIANSSVAGVIKIGNNLAANNTGHLRVNLTGPYANDSAANTAGVALHALYYDASGIVKIRLI